MHIVVYPNPLKGVVYASGNKNSALPVLAAALLAEGKVILNNIPNITDVGIFLGFLKELGIRFKYDPKLELLQFDMTRVAKKRSITITDSTNLGRIRASILLLGALVTRFPKVIFRSSIGGCKLGARSLEVHFSNLRKMGVEVTYNQDSIVLDASGLKKAKGNTFIWQEERSVTATELALIIATARKGRTAIYNAASEPHVIDTGLFLRKLGHTVKGLGTDFIEIIPKDSAIQAKYPIEYTIFSDYHELTTWLAAGLLSKGKVSVVHNIPPPLLVPIERMFSKFGITLTHKVITPKTNFISELLKHKRRLNRETNTDDIRVLPKKPEELPTETYNLDESAMNNLFITSLKTTKIKTQPEEIKQHHIVTFKPHPWPGFPVDLLPLFMPVAAYGDSPVLFHNWMYDQGLLWANELRKGGVHVVVSDPHRVIIIPGKDYRAATFEAPYIIRATISLVLFAMSVKGQSTILNADALLRAHPYFMDKIKALGAKIEVL